MFERFTVDARRVVVLAQETARSLNHERIGSEHVLIGLAQLPASIAGQALRRLGVSAESLKDELRQVSGTGATPPAGPLVFSALAKKVFELSLREALQLKHTYIGTEHILLALEREGTGLGAIILANQVSDLKSVRATVTELINDGLRESSASEPPPTTRTSAADEVVTAAQALAGEAPMGSHHLLEALIRAEGSMAAKVLSGLGIDAAAIASKVDEFDAEDTTDATPQEIAARKMELRVVDDEVHLIFRDQDTVGLAKAVGELIGGPVTATGPVTGKFVPLWTKTNEMLVSLLQTLRNEPVPEGADTGKAALLVRRVLHDRLRRRGGQS